MSCVQELVVGAKEFVLRVEPYLGLGRISRSFPVRPRSRGIWSLNPLDLTLTQISQH